MGIGFEIHMCVCMKDGVCVCVCVCIIAVLANVIFCCFSGGSSGVWGRGVTQQRGRGRGLVLDQPVVQPNMTQPYIPGFTGQPGLKKPVQGTKPVDYYRLFLTDDIVQHFVTETNLHAEQAIAVSRPQKRFARLKDWTETDAGEMKKFLGLILLTGIVSKPTLASYWSTSVLLNAPIFSLVMPRNRFQSLMPRNCFQSLLRFWHCSDHSKEPVHNDPNWDRLYKIRPLVWHLQEEFQSIYTPGKYVAIDESLLLWKGQLVFKQYIPLKSARFGIKLFNVCEDSEYMYKFHIYTGKEDPAFQIQQHIPDDAAHLTATEIVVLITMNLQNKGYHLFIDNWYSSSRRIWSQNQQCAVELWEKTGLQLK